MKTIATKSSEGDQVLVLLTAAQIHVCPTTTHCWHREAAWEIRVHISKWIWYDLWMLHYFWQNHDCCVCCNREEKVSCQREQRGRTNSCQWVSDNGPHNLSCSSQGFWMGSIQNNKEPQSLGPSFIIHIIRHLFGGAMAKHIQLCTPIHNKVTVNIIHVLDYAQTIR